MTSTLKSIHLDDEAVASFLRVEKDQAVRMLCEESLFRPVSASIAGPYELSIRIHEGRLVMEIKGDQGRDLPALVLSVKPYSRLIRDYFMMIESCEALRKTGTACQIEPVDMARRGLHNEGAELLMERLNGKIELDKPTARRLFTLICALHNRDYPLF